MIVFLTLIYIALLILAKKRQWIQWTLWWKISPVIWVLGLFIALFIPLQFWSPTGTFISGNYTVAIVPQVSGEVTELLAEPNAQLKQGDVLFTIEKTPFSAALKKAQAALELARIRVTQEQELIDRGVGKPLDLDRAKRQFEQAEATVESAQFNLDSTVVRAPSDGYVTNVTLRKGARAVSLPFMPAMSFIESNPGFSGAYILQNHLRYVTSGLKAEVAFKMYPGRVFDATVTDVIPARATGFEGLTGLPIAPQQLTHAPFVVKIELGKEAKALNMPSGVTGDVAIYSDVGGFAHVIRKVELRMKAILNYINPF